MKNNILLSLEKLTVKIDSNIILSEISFQLNKNEILGIVGESGSGKSITALSILNLLNNSSFQSEGSIVFEGIELSNLSKKKIEKIRGKDISIIFQEPMSSLNPSMKCGHQILEIVTNHNKSNKESDVKKVLDLIEKVPKFDIFIFFSFIKLETIRVKYSSIKFSEIFFENPICI